MSLRRFVPGSDALGPHDISFSGFSAYFVVGLGGDPALRDELGELGPQFGQLYKASPYRGVRAVADHAAFEAAESPDGEELNSNPTSVLARHGRQYVVDAGGNDLLKVGHDGGIEALAVFPPVADVQAVPTAVTRGPDHALYVSQLTGFPFPVGGAKVYRVDKRGGEPEVYASGFTNVTDLAFGRDGSLYVVEIATNGLLSGDPTGALKRVAPDGSVETIASEGLEAPYGVAIGLGGTIYVTNKSTSVGEGEVVRVHAGH